MAEPCRDLRLVQRVTPQPRIDMKQFLDDLQILVLANPNAARVVARLANHLANKSRRETYEHVHRVNNTA